MAAKLEWELYKSSGSIIDPSIKSETQNTRFTVKQKDSLTGLLWDAHAVQCGNAYHLGNGTLPECLQMCEDAATEVPKEDTVFSGHGPITIEEAISLTDIQESAVASNTDIYLYNYITTGGLVTQSTEDRLIRLAAIVRGILLREDESNYVPEEYPR